MDCTGVNQVYNRIKNSLKASPMYQILQNRDKGICYRDDRRNQHLFYTPTCCTFDKEMALALTSSALFRKYVYTDCLQDYKYALHDITSYYKGEVGKVLDPRLREHVMYLENSDGGKAHRRDLMKEQLRYFLQKKEQVNVPQISDACFQHAENFQWAFRNYLDEYLDQLTALRDGIDVAIELIEALQNQKLSPKCVEAITRSSVLTIGCNQCTADTIGFKTCKTYCANVVNGCIKPLLPIIPVWKEWQTIMDSLDFNFNKEKDKLLKMNITNILYTSLDHNLAGKCNIARDSGVKRRTRKLERVSENSGRESRPLYQDLFHDMFSDLQYKFCQELDFASKSNNECWNGTHVAPYLSNFSLFTEEGQQNNTEVPDNNFIYYTAQQALTNVKNFNLKLSNYRNGDGSPVTAPLTDSDDIPSFTTAAHPFVPQLNSSTEAAVRNHASHTQPSFFFILTIVFSVHVQCSRVLL